MRLFYALCSLSLLNGTAFAKELGNEEISKTRVAKRQDTQGVCSAPEGSSVAFLPPDSPLSQKANFAYNIPARIHPENSSGFFLGAEFIYWNVGEEYLDLGRSALFGAAGSTPALDAGVATQDFDYEPGFRVMLGYNSNYDDWCIEGIYTYLHTHNKDHAGTFQASYAAGDPVLVLNEWFVNASNNRQQQASVINSSWDLNLDMGDFLLSRPFYEGRRVTITPKAGLRGLWLRQKFNIDATLATAPLAAPIESRNKSYGWGVGPHFQGQAHWIIGKGFRFQGHVGTSLLYMRYTTRAHTEAFPAGVAGTAVAPINGHMPSEGFIRAISETGLGCGWGAYLYGKYHIDFSAQYDFTLLWNQNVMRETVGYLANNSIGYSNPIGNVSLHGLTVSGRFDF